MSTKSSERPKRIRRSASRGFTMAELFIALGVVAVGVSLAVGTLGSLKTSEVRRERSRTIIGHIRNARSAARMLGPAGGTDRAQLDASCTENGIEPAFRRTGRPRSAVLFQPRTALLCPSGTANGCCRNRQPCDLVTVVTDVTRNDAPALDWSGDRFTLRCRTFELADQTQLMLDPARFENFQTGPVIGGAASYFLDFDARGFIAGPVGLAARVGLVGVTGQATPGSRGIVVLGSGFACPEGNNLECQRN